MGFNMINGVFYATTYHPIQAGSIDGTDIAPHDNGVYRALLASSTGLCMLSLSFLSPSNISFAFHVMIAWVGACVITNLTIDRDMCLLDMWHNMANGNWIFLIKHRFVNRLSLIRTSIGINFGWEFVRRWSTWWSQSRGRPLLLPLCWPPFTSNWWEDPSWGMCPNYFDYHLISLLRKQLWIALGTQNCENVALFGHVIGVFWGLYVWWLLECRLCQDLVELRAWGWSDTLVSFGCYGYLCSEFLWFTHF